MNLDAIRWVAGTVYRIAAVFQDAGQNPLTGLSPTVLIKRSSDNKYLNNGGTWQSGVPSPLPTMTELDATNFPGRYYFPFTPPAEAFGVWYDALADGTAAAENRYWDVLIWTRMPVEALCWVKKIGGDDEGQLEILDTDGSTVLATLTPSQPDEETLKMTLA